MQVTVPLTGMRARVTAIELKEVGLYDLRNNGMIPTDAGESICVQKRLAAAHQTRLKDPIT